MNARVLAGRTAQVAAAAVLAAWLAACGGALPAPAAAEPAPPPFPPNVVTYSVPNALGYTTTASAWCDGTTRVYVVGMTGSGVGLQQNIEPNAPTCGGRP